MSNKALEHHILFFVKQIFGIDNDGNFDTVINLTSGEFIGIQSGKMGRFKIFDKKDEEMIAEMRRDLETRKKRLNTFLRGCPCYFTMVIKQMKEGTPFDELDEKIKNLIIRRCDNDENAASNSYQKILEISNIKKRCGKNVMKTCQKTSAGIQQPSIKDYLDKLEKRTATITHADDVKETHQAIDSILPPKRPRDDVSAENSTEPSLKMTIPRSLFKIPFRDADSTATHNPMSPCAGFSKNKSVDATNDSDDTNSISSCESDTESLDDE